MSNTKYMLVGRDSYAVAKVVIVVDSVFIDSGTIHMSYFNCVIVI